jgi:hypothetical protein
MLAASGESRQALDHLRTALSAGQSLLASHPNDLVLHRELANCYVGLGRYYEKDRPAEARQWYQKDLDIWTKWPRIAVPGRLDQVRRDEAAHNIARCDQRLPG